MIKIEKIYVDPICKNQNIPVEVSNILNINIEYKNKDDLISEMKIFNEKEIFNKSKKILFFTENKGNFLKKCPGSKGVICCNYYTINSITGCPFDCYYCILQHYILNNPFITIFTNREKIIKEISEFLEKNKFIRVGTGELTDSLIFDDILNESGFFLNNIYRNGWYNNIIFEFKTKSNNVENLIENYKRYPNCNIVVGFSVNIPEIIEKEELYTNNINERINAAKLCTDNGIDISIHFDPVVMLDKYLKEYISLINYIFTTLPHSKIRWISIGGLRFHYSLYPIIRERNSNSNLLAGEIFYTKDDDKYRYLSNIRRKFYKIFKYEIEKLFPDAPIYFCMEKKFIWEEFYEKPRMYFNKRLKEVFLSKVNS